MTMLTLSCNVDFYRCRAYRWYGFDDVGLNLTTEVVISLD